jgi:photosystem II stability/assembly factor-like uncharacterized protein
MVEKEEKMITKRLVVVTAILGAVLLLVALMLGNVSADASAAPSAGPEFSLSPPSVTDVAPALAPNDIDTAIVITGTGFSTGLSGTLVVTSPTAHLGSTPLEDVTWVNSTTLHATVLWGLSPGIYTLTVQNPSGRSASLPNALTVTQGIGVWTSGGPHGGVIGNIVLHPTNPSRVYATAEGSGLFVSDDSGEHWRLLLIYRIVKRPAIDLHQPEVIYLGVGNSLLRSEDGGSSWNHIVPPQVPTGEHAYELEAFAHPAISGTVYLAVWGYYDEGTGVYRSSDRGETWAKLTTGLTDTQVSSLAFDPLNPDLIYAATLNGNVFSSADGGNNWEFGAQVTTDTGDFVKRVYVNPFGAHEVWFVDEGCGRVFTSSGPSLLHWEPVTITTGIQSLTFHPTISGTIWAAGGAGLVSTDGGQTWQSAGSGLWPGSLYTHGVKNFAVDAMTNPANPILYAGTGRGMYKSVDGGLSWFESHQDLSGVVVWKLAVSPHDPQELYASTASRGALWSGNGGHSWVELDMPQSGWFADLVVDPITPTRLYFTGEDGSSGTLLPVVRISNDRGASWHTRVLSIPHALQAQGWYGRAYALAVDPSQPGHLLAGIGLYPPGWTGGWVGPRGGLYLSQDYGEHWQMIQPSVPISHVAVIVYDPVDPQIVYAGTRGGTLLKSVDSGVTWQSIYTWPGIPDIVTIAVHPTHHEIALAGLMESARGIPGGEDGLFRSADGGHSWELLSEGSWVWVLAYDAHDPPFLYAGSGGLWRSIDNGQTWEVAAGLSQGDIESLVTTTDGERVIVYVGITSGAIHKSGMTAASAGADLTLLGSGVYRLTALLPTQWVYLPLVVKGYVP